MHYIGIPGYTQSMVAYDFDWVFLDIPVKNCIVGVLLVRPLHSIELITIVLSVVISRQLPTHSIFGLIEK